MPSSPIRVLVDRLADLGTDGIPCPQQVLVALGSVPDPRYRRGVRHPITGIRVIAICAVTPGAHSFTAIAEWAADTAAGLLAPLGVGTPDSSTIRRPPLNRMDAEAFDQALAG